MQKIKTLIADDEPLAIELVKHCLESHPQIEVVATCRSGREAYSKVVELQPDLLLLDIQMPIMTGVELALKLQSDIMPMIVFITAFDEYALQAFDVHAVDYLLKPVDQEKLDRAIERCIERYSQGSNPEFKKENVINALTDYHEKLETDEQIALPKIVVKDRGTITIIEQEDIDWVDAAGDYVCIHVDGKTHIMRNTMKGIMADLTGDFFRRVHRSTIVNMSRIQQVIPHTKGECFLDIGENNKIKVSRNYRTVVQDYLKDISGS